MARPETQLDYTSFYARAKLAGYLRQARGELTFGQLAAGSALSAATLKRAAHGSSVPTREVVEEYIAACTVMAAPGRRAALTAEAVRLWKRARWEQRHGSKRAYLPPNPHLIADWRDLSRELRHLYAYAGAPRLREMEARAGGLGILPHTTAHRIVKGASVPVSELQLTGFLRACEVAEMDFILWVLGYRKCAARDHFGQPVVAFAAGGPGI